MPGPAEDKVMDRMPEGSKLYFSTQELQEKCAQRTIEKWCRKEVVNLSDVRNEVDDLGADNKDKWDGSELASEERDKLLKQALLSLKEKPELTAARVCQIERRLREDTTIANELDANGHQEWDMPAKPAFTVKQQMKKSYKKMKKNMYDLTNESRNKINDRIHLLSRDMP